MRLALMDLYHAKWTQEIQEWMRNLLKNRPDLTKDTSLLEKSPGMCPSPILHRTNLSMECAKSMNFNHL